MHLHKSNLSNISILWTTLELGNEWVVNNHLNTGHTKSCDTKITLQLSCTSLPTLSDHGYLQHTKIKQKETAYLWKSASSVCIRFLISSSFKVLHSTKMKYPKWDIRKWFNKKLTLLSIFYIWQYCILQFKFLSVHHQQQQSSKGLWFQGL